MASLFDLLSTNQPAKYDVYDAPDVGLTPAPTPTTQDAMGSSAAAKGPDWSKILAAFAKQGGGGMAAPQQGAAVRPPTATGGPARSQAASHQGFISDSKSGFNLDDLIKLAALVGTAGAASPAVAGAMGGGTAMGASAGAAAGGGAASGTAMGGMLGMGGGGGGGVMSMLGGMGGGGEQKAPPVSYAPLPPQPGPLVPQSAFQWQPGGYGQGMFG